MDLGIAFGDQFAVEVKTFNCHYKLRPALNINTRKEAIETQTKCNFPIFCLTECGNSLQVLKYFFSYVRFRVLIVPFLSYYELITDLEILVLSNEKLG